MVGGHNNVRILSWSLNKVRKSFMFYAILNLAVSTNNSPYYQFVNIHLALLKYVVCTIHFITKNEQWMIGCRRSICKQIRSRHRMLELVLKRRQAEWTTASDHRRQNGKRITDGRIVIVRGESKGIQNNGWNGIITLGSEAHTINFLVNCAAFCIGMHEQNLPGKHMTG